ncbi:cell cycle checkpoint protein RAD17 isoform X3 [Anoplolepis gracilipes]|uniref:cell cycle checkpoint protein RAD17 isoform X3 n=1 Tax=Anoplolepis gracilipes TaxID=354296 RepID=UPI003BA04AFD
MAHPKRNNKWCVPSFDCEIINEPLVKRTKREVNKTIEELDKTLSNYSFTQNNFKRRKSETSLSKLLETCEPKKLSELVVSKQKQNEIFNWFQYKASNRQPSMLVLSGPSGCGKTVAIKLLAKENGFNIIEWITPIDQMEDENKHVIRQGDKFEDHVIRATRYHTVLGNCSKQLLLVKDLPNVYHEDHKGFFTLVEKYFQMGKDPVIFICTETGNSRLMQTLFAPDVREKFGIDLINVNAATQTAMKNMLKRVSGVLNSIASDMLHVSQQHIDEILSNSVGDVRSAVLNLIFISLKEESDGDSSKFVHDPEEIAAFFQSQSVVFVQFLQENYLNTIRTIEEATVASDILSLADVLNSEWRDRNLGKVALSYCIRGLMLTNEKPVARWNPVRKPRDTHSNIRRCLVTAETQWYESIIKPCMKKTNEISITNKDEDMEIIIEED